MNIMNRLASVDVAVRMDQEQRILDEMICLLRTIPDPQEWPEPYRQIFAQAILPFLRYPPGSIPRLGREHAKGLLLMAMVYGGRAVVERIPAWILRAARKGSRDPELERTAERVRHNLARVFKLRKGKPDGK